MPPEPSPRIYLGHDPSIGDDGLDLLLTVWPDGTAQLATRPGRDQRWVTWSPPLALTPDSLREPTGYVAPCCGGGFDERAAAEVHQ